MCQPLPSVALTTKLRWWSLAASLASASAPGAAATATVEQLLAEVRSRAAASSQWTVDFGELAPASSSDHGLRADAQLVGRVAATLAGVLTAPAAPTVTSLCLTITSPEAARAVRRLCDTTPLLAALQSLHVTVDASAAGAPLDGSSGHEVALLLQALAAHRGTRQSTSATWTELRVAARDTTAFAATAPATVTAPLWDEAAVAALAALVAAAPWRCLALSYIELSPSSARVRQRLWAAIEGSEESLVSLDLTGVRHSRELVSMRVLRRLVHLESLELGHTQLEEDAVEVALDDVREGRGGWWALRHLGLAQCEVSDAVVTRLHEHRPDPNAEAAPALESLNVSGARLSRAAVFALAGCLLPCTRLQRLHTRHCRLLPANVEDVTSSLQHAAELREWVLCHNRIGDEGLVSLATYARCWPALSEMDLARCRLTCASVPALSAALPCWANLRTLRLTGNDLRWRDEVAATSEQPGVGGLFAYDPAYMRSHGSSVKVPTAFELDRRDREEGRRRYTGTEGVVVPVTTVSAAPPLEQLGEALSACTQLRVLDLGDCAMGDAQLVQLATHFTGAALQELRLGSNHLLASVQGLDALVTVLWRTPRLGTLDLSFTGLGDLGMSMLCDGDGGGAVLPAAVELHTLLLAGCGVASLGWESLAAAVGDGRLPALRHLALHHNRVADVALAGELLRQLRTAPALATVDLSGCVADAEARWRLQGGAECRALLERGVQVLL